MHGQASQKMLPDSRFESSDELRYYEALLQLADLMVHHQDLGELFCSLAERLRCITSFDLLSLALHDPAKNVMRIQPLNGQGPIAVPNELPVEDAPAGWVWREQQPLVVPDVQAETRFPKVMPVARHRGIRSSCFVPLTTAQRRLGGMEFGSLRPNAYSERDVLVLQRVAALSALAVENAITRTALRKEQERVQMLLEVNAALVSNRDVKQLFPALSGFIRNVVKQEFASIRLYDEGTQSLRLHVQDFPATNRCPADDSASPLRGTAAGVSFLEREARVFSREQLAEFHHPCSDLLLQQGVKSGCCLPLITAKGPLGVLELSSREADAFLPQDVSLLKQVAAQLAVAIENAQAYREIAQLKDRLTEEKRYLQGEIRTALNFEEIIGDSDALRRVLKNVKTVAGSDATVLLLGETGTGKELVARAIHRMSSRSEASFIKLNCAAIPTGLLESELFGHEKGAFTGAISQKVGRMELADKGTLFLDEVGDIPLELQPKLLRVLQDQEFERLGSTRTIHVDVRLVTATNLDLEASVARHEFRDDLYYRLKVFPIRMPALRERREDIPLLVRYFVQKFAQQMNRQIDSIPSETIHALENWHWPGNVRELENFIERSVILSEGGVLRVPLAELSGQSSSYAQGTLLGVEREHIIRALRESDGVIAGEQGAAARLGMKRTTLQSMMKRMNITRGEYEK